MAKVRDEGPTISDVAQAAGVARSSVSRAFTRPEMLSAETVKRVMDAAASLGYIPNHTARALSTGRHGNVALIIPDVANPFFPPLIRAVQMAADSTDLCVFLGNSDEAPQQEDRLVSRFLGQVEGLILASSRLPDERIAMYASQRPLVLINRDMPGIPRVLIDSGIGVAEAVQHLADLGHSRIAYVAGPTTSWSNKQRRAAVLKAGKRAGVAIELLGPVVPTHEAGMNAVPALLASGATAAVAFDDLTAQGVLAGLMAQGIVVPDDFGVVGCDDVLGAMTYPALTSVSSRSAEAGKAALSLLSDRMSGNGLRDVRYVLDTHLVVRGTTAGYRAPAAAPHSKRAT